MFYFAIEKITLAFTHVKLLLLQNNWVARRDDYNPKTFAEIQKDKQSEDQQKAAMAAAYELNKQQGGSGGHAGRGLPPPRMARSSGNPNQCNNGWQMATSGKNSKSLSFFEADKMKISGSSHSNRLFFVIMRNKNRGLKDGASQTST